MKVDKITVSQLKYLIEIEQKKTLILDCRPYLVYSKECILGASNFSCPSIVKRRFLGKRCINLEKLLPQEIKKKLKSGDYVTLVLYDSLDKDVGFEKCPEITMVLQGLKQNCYSLKRASVLRGGFKRFRSEYPQLCSRLAQDSDNEDLELSTLPKSGIKLTPSKINHVPSELLPYLYIGNENDAVNREVILDLGITAVLNVSTVQQSHVTKDLLYKEIPVHDNNNEDLFAFFDEAVRFIDAVANNKGKVLVHCKAGISRSATICIAYLMYHKGWTLEQAFDYVHARRNVVSPNVNFMQQLIQFEKCLFSNILLSSFTRVCPVTCTNGLKSTEKMA